MNKKTCFITGANSGIGKQAAIQLAQAEFHVIIGVRNRKRGEIALIEIKEKSESNGVELLEIDMSSKDSILRASQNLNQQLNSLDVLIHNAADFNIIARKQPQESIDEYTLSVGDSILQKIDEGLQSCRFAVIIVSKQLLSRKKWSLREYRSLSSRETESGKKVILPVWRDVTRDEVSKYSLDLADKYALDASLGTESLAKALKNEVRKST